ncbi:hypothetical protein SDC9_191884 [bioreactor metagenome]|uniref:Uncharacterized protein n=1 Tax=bioreactor metagenome TaxID=1076179 RepID=A0A645I0Q4_9ZZZZ
MSEDGMFAVKPGRRHECDEELRTAGIGAGVGHGEYPRFVMLEALAEFVGDVVAGAACAVALRAAALDHELIDDAVEGEAVVVALLREVDEVFHRLRREIVEEFDLECAVVRLEGSDLTFRRGFRGVRRLRLLRREGEHYRRRHHCAECQYFHHCNPPSHF